jgi:DNA-binding protein YbaB
MTSPQQALGEIFAEVNRMQQDLVAFRERMATTKASATAPKRLLTVEVDHTGELTKLKFNTGAYRDMAPGELSTVVMETIARARKLVSAKVREGMSGITGPAGLSLEDMRAGKVDLDQLLPQSLPTGPAEILKFFRGGQQSVAGAENGKG